MNKSFSKNNRTSISVIKEEPSHGDVGDQSQSEFISNLDNMSKGSGKSKILSQMAKLVPMLAAEAPDKGP